MTSGDNSFNYFPDNQLTKFIAAPHKISMMQRASSPPQDGRPCFQKRCPFCPYMGSKFTPAVQYVTAATAASSLDAGRSLTGYLGRAN